MANRFERYVGVFWISNEFFGILDAVVIARFNEAHRRMISEIVGPVMPWDIGRLWFRFALE